jgi:hypothetical protein
MKKTIFTALVAFGCLLHNLPASVTLTGTALSSSVTATPSNPLSLTSGQVAIWLNKDDVSTAWSTLFGAGAIGSGLSLTADSTYNASLFTVMGSVTATGTNTRVVSGGITNLNLANGITSGDQYAVLVFATSLTTTVAGDTFNIWRASDWLIPSDGSSVSYSSTPLPAGPYQQIKDASYLLGSGSVIPEPSSASLLALGVAGLVALRVRRKS